MRNGLVRLYLYEVLFCFTATLISECSAVYYTKIVGDLIGWIKEPPEPELGLELVWYEQ